MKRLPARDVIVRLLAAGLFNPQTSRTQPRSQRCAGSASSRGCQSRETVISGMATGSGKLCIPARRFPVWRSGTLAIRSEARASASAAEKPPTIATISRSSPSGCQRLVDRSAVEPPPRDEDVPAGRIAGGRDLALAQRVPRAHDADEAVAEQRLRAHLRTRRLARRRRFPDRRCRRAAARCPCPASARSAAARRAPPAPTRAMQVRSEILDEAFAGPQRERADQLLEVERLGRAQHRFARPAPAGRPARAARAPAASARGRVRPGPAADRPSSRAAAPAPGSSPTG